MKMILILTGTLTANINVIVPSEGRVYVVDNRTSASYIITFKTATGSGFAVPQADRTFLYCDGTDVFPVGTSGGGGGGAPTDASYLVSSAHSLLTGERVVTDTATVLWDHATAGQSKATVPAASETATGVVALATQADTDTGTDDARAITPLKLATRLTAGLPPAASETVAGLVELATAAETTTGTDTTRATHPAGVHAALEARVPAGTPLSVVRYAASGTTLESTPLTIDATPLAVLTNADLVVRRTSDTSTLAIEGVAGTQRVVSFRTGTVQRWLLLATTGAELGSDVGSDLQIVRRNDAGGSLGAALHLQRSTGNLGLGTTLGTALGSGATYPLLSVKGSQLFVGQSSVQERAQALLASTWVTSTDASRKARLTLSVYDATAAREGLRLEADGSAARLGFFGSAAVVKPTVTGSRGGNAALASALTALASLGLLTDSSTA